MHKQRILLIGVPVAVLATVALVLMLTREREPEYEGKKLSEWVRGLEGPTEAARQEAHEAVGNIGTNGLPYLVKLVGHDMSPLKRRFYSSTNPLVKRLVAFWWVFDKRDAALQFGAAHALIQLGAKAEGAVGDLSRLASRTKPSLSRNLAASVLCEMGKPGLPALVGILTNQLARGGNWTSDSVVVANYIWKNAGMDRQVGELGIPALLSMSKNPNPRIRAAATNALLVIDPQALERAGK